MNIEALKTIDRNKVLYAYVCDKLKEELSKYVGRTGVFEFDITFRRRGVYWSALSRGFQNEYEPETHTVKINVIEPYTLIDVEYGYVNNEIWR